MVGALVRAGHTRRNVLNLSHEHPPVDDAAKDDVFAVEEVGLAASDEELASIRIGARVGLCKSGEKTAPGVRAMTDHGQQSGTVVFQGKVLVRKCWSIDGQAASAITLRNRGEREP
jgi:hypothetical protein